jgi:hypothetical protein
MRAVATLMYDLANSNKRRLLFFTENDLIEYMEEVYLLDLQPVDFFDTFAGQSRLDRTAIVLICLNEFIAATLVTRWGIAQADYTDRATYSMGYSMSTTLYQRIRLRHLG